MRQRKRPLRLDRANVAGVIQSEAGFKRLRRLPPRVVDVVEIRLDALGAAPSQDIFQSLSIPVIATARHPNEGGENALSRPQREALIRQVLGDVSAVDIELASRRELVGVIAAARDAGCRVIFSAHDFQKTPKLERLREMLQRAADAGADVFKVAVTPQSHGDLGALLALLDRPPIPVAAMGMGKYGRLSRLLCGSCGSVLNYGWIERPVVRGQWSVGELRARLRELGRTS